MFALAFGESPFEKAFYERGGSVALAALSGKYKFPEKHPYSSKVEELIRSMLVVDPQARPVCMEVLQTLNAALSQISGEEKSAVPSPDEVVINVQTPLV